MSDARDDLARHLPALRAFAISLTRNGASADDLVQDTVMKAWAKQSSFEMGTNIKAWLFTILRNEFYSQMRKRGREVQDSDGAFTERLSVHPPQYGSMDMQDFKKALEKLPEEQREAIILVGASGFSYEEAAEICGCALGTIKSRVARGRVALETILGDGSLPSRRTHSNEPGMTALDTIMGEVESLSRDRDRG